MDGEGVMTREKEVQGEQQTWSELPTELLELIMSHLTLKENICASVVCKRWFPIAVSVQVVNQPPWIMYFPKFSDLYEFYEPAQRKSYSLELPRLHGSRVCYTKDGTIPVSNVMIGENKIHLRAFGLNHQKTAQPSFKEGLGWRSISPKSSLKVV
ncbi:F-box/kelch-repeat protein [Camellia lanceoleosa]|uniref:F-box/kelch-repeat protein n=1 Tax=Camellia lanceoleosa TaxID=1840588 RepID=A0ACC0HML3_9ERIC|nr:F-box/kelch-repeat protein [Camellia lanceoleosa]